MAEDVDGNYYYDAGTINEQFDNVEVVENDEGALSIAVGASEVRVEDLAVALTGSRGAATTDELDDGEQMIYVADGSAANSAAGDLVVAKNSSGTITEAVLAASADYLAV